MTGNPSGTGRMTRKEFVKKAAVGAAAVGAIALGKGGTASAALPPVCNITVNPGDDIKAKLEGANEGDTVCVKYGAYSSNSTINLRKSIRIYGEADAGGNRPKITVKIGHCFLIAVPLPVLTFDSLEISGAQAGIMINPAARSGTPTALTINNCVVNGGTAVALRISYSNINATLTDNVFNGNWGLILYPKLAPPFPGTIGTLTAVNNDFIAKGYAYDSGYNFSFGMMLLPNEQGFSASFRNNRISMAAPPVANGIKIPVACGSMLFARAFTMAGGTPVPTSNVEFDGLTVGSSNADLAAVFHLYAQDCVFSNVRLANQMTAKEGIDMGWETLPSGFFQMPDGIVQNLSNGNKFAGVDFSMLTATAAQAYLESSTHHNHVGLAPANGNKFGKVALTEGIAGIRCEGFSNTFLGNDYRQSGLPGWGMPGHPTGVGCVLLGESSHGNLVDESGGFPAGTGGARFQVKDAGDGNRVVGLPAENAADPGIGQEIRRRMNSQNGGNGPFSFGFVWNEETQQWE